MPESPSSLARESLAPAASDEELLPEVSLVRLAPGSGEAPGRWQLFSEDGRGSARVVDLVEGGHALRIENRGRGSTIVFFDLEPPEAHRSKSYELSVRVRCETRGGAWLSVHHQKGEDRWADRAAGCPGWERLSLREIVPFDATRLRACIYVAPGCSAEVRDASFRAGRVPALHDPSLEDLCEEMPDASLPLLDRRELDESDLDEHQRFWRENGYLILERFIPDTLIDPYCRVREKLDRPGGYPSVNPYLQVPEIKDLCLHGPLMDVLERLIGEPMGMHLNLTGWVSTERDWHQDDYLNPPSVNNHYLAVWFALDEISPEAGPFEYIPGSHRWFALRRDRVLRFVEPEDRTQDWTKTSESFVGPLVRQEIARRDEKAQAFLGRKGDVLIWNGRLLHRGSPPRDRSLQRKAIITHYSGIHRRKDVPDVVRHRGQGYYF